MSRPSGINPALVIIAFPAGLILLLVIVLVIAFSLRPAKETTESPVVQNVARPAAPKAESPPAEPTEAPADVPAVAEPVAVVPTAPPVATTMPAAITATATQASSPASDPAVAPIDLLASLDLESAAVTGDWRKDGGAIRCKNATTRNRAKLRLVPPPAGDGYDLTITFTAQGEKRFVAPVLSFRGRQFIFAMFSNQSGFASIRGQNALANETTRNKGIKAGAKHTALIKVRDREVSAYLDGELVSSYATDYSDLDVSGAWNLGPSSARESLIGLAAECPVTVEAITLTPLQAQPTSAPAPSSYKDLAAMISSPFSTDSSSAATQPAARRRISPGELQPLIAASQPVVSDIASGLAAPPPASAPDAAARDELYRAVQLAVSPAVVIADPLMDSQPAASAPISVDRAEFDAEQSRLAAWRALLARINDFYPNAKTQRDVLKVRLAPENSEAAKSKAVGFFATHSHSERLTNVTLAIELVHAITSPSPTALQHYYIPHWAPGQRIFFPMQCIPNVSSRELLEGSAPPVGHGLSGLIEARVELWSDKVAQPKQSISFDANFQSLARAQLEEAYRVIDEALRRPAGASRPATAAIDQRSPAPPVRSALIAGPIVPVRTELDENDPDVARARAAARRARSLLPPQSSLADDARDLVAQPQTALRDLRKRQVDAFVEAMSPRATRSGMWVMHKPGMVARLAKPADRDAVLGAAGAAGGRVVLTIDSRTNEGASVAATLTSADQPDMKRKFTGRLQVDVSANRLLLNLRSTQPPPGRAPTEAELKKVVHWTSLLLELRGNSLLGIATAGPSDNTVLSVAFGPPTAAPEPAAAPAAPKARQRPTTAKAK